MSRSVCPDYEAMRERQARAQESAAPEPCAECKVADDHTWWCSIAPAVLPDGKRPYYWRD